MNKVRLHAKLVLQDTLALIQRLKNVDQRKLVLLSTVMELAGLRNTAQQAHSMSSKVPLFQLIAKTVQQVNTAQILPIQPTRLKPSPVHQESTAWVKPLHQKIVHQDFTVQEVQL
jgi:hypothetical protein